MKTINFFLPILIALNLSNNIYSMSQIKKKLVKFYNDFKYDSLINAASNGDTKKIKTLLKKEHDINFINEHGLTILDHAIMNIQHEAVELLVQSGANINLKTSKYGFKEQTSLEWFLWCFNDLDKAVTITDQVIIDLHSRIQKSMQKDLSKCLKTFTTLLELGAEFDQSIMRNLFHIYHHEVLLKTYDEYYNNLQKINSEGIPSLPIACINIITEYITFSPESMDFMQSVQTDSVENLTKIIKRKNNFKISLSEYTNGIPNFRTISFTSRILAIAVEDAIKSENYELVDDLIKQKADIDTPIRDIPKQNVNNLNCMSLAIQYNSTKMVEYLLEKGANPNYQTKNDQKTVYTVLIHSSMSDIDIEIMQLLLKYGAIVNTQTEIDGLTALIIAASHCSLDKVKLLVNSKADINPKDLDDRTALDYARKENNHEIVEYLQSKLEENNLV